MAGRLVLAGWAGVSTVFAKAVRPAVVQGAVASGYGRGIGDSDGGGRERDVGGSRSGVGAVETGGFGSALAFAFLVCFCEVVLERSVRGGRGGKLAPVAAAFGKNASFLQDLEGNAHDRGIGDGFEAISGVALDFLNAEPQVFHGIIWVPCCVELVAIEFKVVVRDDAVSGVKVGEEIKARDVGETESLVGKYTDVARGNGSKELLLECLEHSAVARVFSEVSSILTVGFSDLMRRGVEGQNRLVTRMDGCNESLGSPREVLSGRHDEGEVAVGATATRGMHGFCIRVQFLLEELE